MKKIKDMHLDWCKMECFIIGKQGPSQGGWVSESFFEYGRVLIIMYGFVKNITTQKCIDIRPFE